MKPPTPLGNYNTHTDQPTDQPTNKRMDSNCTCMGDEPGADSVADQGGQVWRHDSHLAAQVLGQLLEWTIVETGLGKVTYVICDLTQSFETWLKFDIFSLRILPFCNQ